MEGHTRGVVSKEPMTADVAPQAGGKTGVKRKSPTRGWKASRRVVQTSEEEGKSNSRCYRIFFFFIPAETAHKKSKRKTKKAWVKGILTLAAMCRFLSIEAAKSYTLGLLVTELRS